MPPVKGCHVINNLRLVRFEINLLDTQFAIYMLCASHHRDK